MRKALHGSSGVTSLPGREVELEKLRTFLKTRLESDDSGSLYISGPPGTGKTASLELVMNENQVHLFLFQLFNIFNFQIDFIS